MHNKYIAKEDTVFFLEGVLRNNQIMKSLGTDKQVYFERIVN